MVQEAVVYVKLPPIRFRAILSGWLYSQKISYGKNRNWELGIGNQELGKIVQGSSKK
jgi:hypothetical protein